MIVRAVARFHADVPAPPASLYIRPTHIGVEAAIGKAAAPTATSIQYVLLSPVGDYFTGGEATLRVLLETEGVRCGADHGMVKGGGNYASALKHIMKARQAHEADQVLFCPDGYVQETGAANFLLIDGNDVITKSLDTSFLHGVTRDSLLTLARERGMDVQERELGIEELLERASRPGCEAGLSGTAAVLTAVGTFIHQGREYKVGDGQPGPVIRELRAELNAIQWGERDDTHGWLTRVEPQTSGGVIQVDYAPLITSAPGPAHVAQPAPADRRAGDGCRHRRLQYPGRTSDQRLADLGCDHLSVRVSDYRHR